MVLGRLPTLKYIGMKIRLRSVYIRIHVLDNLVKTKSKFDPRSQLCFLLECGETVYILSTIRILKPLFGQNMWTLLKLGYFLTAKQQVYHSLYLVNTNWRQISQLFMTIHQTMKACTQTPLFMIIMLTETNAQRLTR